MGQFMSDDLGNMSNRLYPCKVARGQRNIPSHPTRKIVASSLPVFPVVVIALSLTWIWCPAEAKFEVCSKVCETYVRNGSLYD